MTPVRDECEHCHQGQAAHCKVHVVPCCPGRCPRPPKAMFAAWSPVSRQAPRTADEQRRRVLAKLRDMRPGSRGVLAAEVAAWLDVPEQEGLAILMRLRRAGLVLPRPVGKLTRWTLSPDGQRIIAGRDPIPAARGRR